MGLRARLCVCFEAHEINEDSKKLQALMNKSKPKEQTVAKTSSTKRKSTTSESAKGSKGMPKNKKQKSTTSLAGKLSQLSDENESSEDEGMSSDSEPKTKKKKRVASRAKKGSKKVKDEDSEYEEKDRSKNLVKKPTLKKSNSQILSSDEVVEVASTSKPKVCREACARNYWLEVYLEEERVWQPIDPLSSDTDLVGDYFEKRFEKQILYACVFDNDNRVKDVTKRYSSKWTTSTRLLRVDYIEKKLWWERTMLLKQTLDADLDIEEEKQLKKMLLDQSLPVSVSEFKDHPLYVLKRHLLKYQEIYPQDAEPVGHLRNEPIYSRDNQVTLHSRQTWLKYARKVKPYENPYKIVKGRIKQSDYKNGVRENPDLDIYGYWQTNLYDPPIAENGRIPLNEFGNVELFQPCMLPIGTVHLKNMPNLNKLCRKLKLDCAAAVVGFDAHSGFSHAVFNGWVVCEEHKDTIVAAYREEEVRANLKLIEKQQERVWGNWRRIIRALQIREHLKLKYGTEDTDGFKKSKSKQHDSEDEQDQSGQSKKNKQASKVITKKGKKTTPTKKATVKKVKKSSENKQESDEEASNHLKVKRNRKSQESSRTLREDDEKEIECQSSIETNSRSSGTLDNQDESLVLSEVED